MVNQLESFSVLFLLIETPVVKRSSGLSIRGQINSLPHQHVRLQPHQVKLPSFTYQLQNKMKQGTPLDVNEYSRLCRELARPIEVHTLKAHPDHYTELVVKLLNKYPKITLKDGETEDTAVSWLIHILGGF